MLTLEGAQAGLAWITILRKRAGYRRAFADFDFEAVSRFRPARLERLLQDPAIVRNRLKVASTVTNARAFMDVRREFGSFATYLWDFVGGTPQRSHCRSPAEVPARNGLSDRISKDLGRRGFRFVGSTIVYAYLQGVGVVDDHLVSCFRHRSV